MTRSGQERLDDIVEAVAAIRSHLTKGTLEDDVIVDAVRMRLLEVGEAVKCLDIDILATEPDIPWKQIARMRDHLAHRYFLSSTDIIAETVNADLDPLLAAIRRLRDKVDTQPSQQTDHPGS